MATEEQTTHTSIEALRSGSTIRSGQRLTIGNRRVKKLSFCIAKYGSPSGNVTFLIRKVSDNAIIISKIWGDASSLSTDLTWEEVTFDTPTVINEEVRILCEFSSGDSSNYVKIAYENDDLKDSELKTRYVATWIDTVESECAYIYTYELTEGPLPMHFRQ